MPVAVRESKPNVFIGVPRVWEKMYAGVNAAISADPEKEKQFNEGVAAAIPIMEKMTNGTATEEEIATWNFLDEVGFHGRSRVDRSRRSGDRYLGRPPRSRPRSSSGSVPSVCH